MKKNNGFTLIELLAVIIILAAIALVVFPTILNTISDSENQIDEATSKLIENAAKLYVDNNANDYPKREGNTYCVSFDDLIKSNQLEKGIIEAADVDTSSKVVKVTVTDNYDYEIVNNDECTVVLAKICTYKGTDATKKYDYGAEYECDPGDGILRTFYMLEDGDDEALTKGDFTTVHYETYKIGTAGTNEVALIMDRNIGDKIAWCASGNNNSCNADGALAELDKYTRDWTVEVNLPTYNQIYEVNDSVTLKSTPWLYDYLYGTINPMDVSGYYTSTITANGYINLAWYVSSSGVLDDFKVDTASSYGVRPVITISKDEL